MTTDLLLAAVAVGCFAWWRFRDNAVGLRAWKVCAWCEDVMEFGDEGAYISHSICPACTKDWNRNVDKSPRIAA